MEEIKLQKITTLKETEPEGEVIFFGFLKKRSKYLHLWKTRFCILTNHYLFSFTGVERDADCTMALKLDTIISCTTSNIGNNCFVLKTGEGNNYYFQAKHEQDKEVWQTQICKYIKNDLVDSRDNSQININVDDKNAKINVDNKNKYRNAVNKLNTVKEENIGDYN